MTIYEILSFNKELLRRLYSAGINTSDCLYVDLYKDYLRMKENGEKTTYAVILLAERYGMSERKVYKVLNKLRADCRTEAV